MDRKDVVMYIIERAILLEQYEHVSDLAKHGRYEELKEVDLPINAKVTEWMSCNRKISLKDDEIPKGCCFAVAMWFHQHASECFCDRQLFADEDSFIKRLIDETGDTGKSIAYRKEKGLDITILTNNDFFSGKYAADFDGEVHD